MTYDDASQAYVCQTTPRDSKCTLSLDNREQRPPIVWRKENVEHSEWNSQNFRTQIGNGNRYPVTNVPDRSIVQPSYLLLPQQNPDSSTRTIKKGLFAVGGGAILILGPHGGVKFVTCSIWGGRIFEIV